MLQAIYMEGIGDFVRAEFVKYYICKHVRCFFFSLFLFFFSSFNLPKLKTIGKRMMIGFFTWYSVHITLLRISLFFVPVSLGNVIGKSHIFCACIVFVCLEIKYYIIQMKNCDVFLIYKITNNILF